MVLFSANMLAVVAAFLIIIVAYFKWSFTYWKRKGVKTIKPQIPFGTSGQFLLQKASMGQEFQRFYEEFKSMGVRYGGVYLFSKPIFVPTDLNLIKSIMTKDFQYFTDHGNYMNEETDPLSVHLFNLTGLKWKNLRAKLTPTFTSGKMKMMFQTLVDCSNGLTNIVQKLTENNEPVDLKEVVGRFTTDIIGSCAFGIDCNCIENPDSDFRIYGKKFFEQDLIQGAKVFSGFVMPQVLKVFNVTITQKEVTAFFVNLVNETVKYRESNNVVRKDFMHLLIQLKNYGMLKDDDTLKGKSDEKSALTMTEVAAQAFVFFLAGFETSSTLLTFLFYELASNIEIQEKLRQEIRAVLKKHDEKLTYEAIMEMTYMDRCIQEALRKYPPVPVLNRACTKTYKIPDSDVVIEKDTPIFIPILGIQNDPEHYPNPERYDPDRFLEENKIKRHPYTWLPFGEGPRVCIGLRFGLMQTKVGLTVLLKNHKYTLDAKTKMPIKIDPKGLVMSIDGGLWLKSEGIH